MIDLDSAPVVDGVYRGTNKLDDCMRQQQQVKPKYGFKKSAYVDAFFYAKTHYAGTGC